MCVSLHVHRHLISKKSCTFDNALKTEMKTVKLD